MERVGRLIASPEARLVGLTVLLKVAVFAVGALAYLVLTGPLQVPFGIWNRWDAPHYLDIADWGYMAIDPGVSPTFSQRYDLDLFIVFYPLFPWLVAGASLVIPSTHTAGLVVAGAASLVVAPLLFRLVRREFGAAVGMRAAWFLLIFPTAYFLHLAYTEALFLALVLGSFLAAGDRRWWLAGLLGGLAALTRVNGLVLIGVLLVEAWLEWRGERRLNLGWLWIGLVPVGFGIYLAVNQLVYGDPLAFVVILDDHWFKHPAPPWAGIRQVWEWATNFDDLNRAVWNGWAELIFIVLGAIASIWSLIRFRAPWTVWMVGNWLLFTSTSFVLSVPRYSLTLFPAFVALALFSPRKWQLVVISLISGGLMVALTARFAIGQWAF